MSPPKSCGSRIRSAREAAGLSQAEVARLINRSRTAVGQWEDGKTIPRHKNLIALAHVFKVDIATLTPFGSDTTRPVDVADLFVPLLSWGDLARAFAGESNVRIETAERIAGSGLAIDRDHEIAVEIQDDSMSPEFRPGEVVWVDLKRKPAAGQYVLLRLAIDGIVLLRRYVPRSADAWDAVPLNPDMQTVTINRSRRARVIGVVCAHRRNLVG